MQMNFGFGLASAKRQPPVEAFCLQLVNAITHWGSSNLHFFLPKKLLQELCSDGLGWDNPIAPENERFWQNYVTSLQALSSVGIPRCYRPRNFEPVEIQLHCFCDASQKGYGVVFS